MIEKLGVLNSSADPDTMHHREGNLIKREHPELICIQLSINPMSDAN